MLRVIYEATETLESDRLVAIHETRGRLTIQIRRGVTAVDYVAPLNAALQVFLAQCGWFQIWRGQIVGANHPANPLTVKYVADPDVDRLSCVQIRERKGIVRLHVCPDVTSEELVRALNPAIENFLHGGQWFQLWHGEIVTMDDDSRGSAAA